MSTAAGSVKSRVKLSELVERGLEKWDAGSAEHYRQPDAFYQPPEWFHEGQLKAWRSEALEIVTVAGTQGGKTATQAPWLLREIQRSAPLIRMLGSGKFIYAGPTMTLLQEQALPYFEWLFQDEERLGRLIKGSKP